MARECATTTAATTATATCNEATRKARESTNERTNCALSEMLKCIITVHFAHTHTPTLTHTNTLTPRQSKADFRIALFYLLFFSFAAFNVARILFALIDS